MRNKITPPDRPEPTRLKPVANYLVAQQARILWCQREKKYTWHKYHMNKYTCPCGDWGFYHVNWHGINTP